MGRARGARWECKQHRGPGRVRSGVVTAWHRTGRISPAPRPHARLRPGSVCGEPSPTGTGPRRGNDPDWQCPWAYTPASPPRAACGLGRTPCPATPASPSSRAKGARLSCRVKRLRFARHRVAALPHHCRALGFFRACLAGLSKPHPGWTDAGSGPANLPGSGEILLWPSKTPRRPLRHPSVVPSPPPVDHLRTRHHPRAQRHPGREDVDRLRTRAQRQRDGHVHPPPARRRAPPTVSPSSTTARSPRPATSPASLPTRTATRAATASTASTTRPLAPVPSPARPASPPTL